MFIANDSNYTFGQFLDVENGADIKAPVYSKCFTDTEALKGYRFIHDPEETNPEKCVSFSIYNETDSAALAMPFGKFAAVSDLTSVMFRLDTEIVEGVLRDVSYYHVIVPVENIADNTRKYLVIKMTKEVELFPENYPYYELVSTFADAEPTSAEPPTGGGGGGESDFSIAKLTVISTAETPYGLELPYCDDYDNYSGTAISNADLSEYSPINVILYKGKAKITLLDDGAGLNVTTTGNIDWEVSEGFLTGDATMTIESGSV